MLEIQNDILFQYVSQPAVVTAAPRIVFPLLNPIRSWKISSAWHYRYFIWGLLLCSEFDNSFRLGSTQPRTETSSKNISWWGGVKRPVRKADNLATFMCRLSWNSGNLNLLEPFWAYTGNLYLYLLCDCGVCVCASICCYINLFKTSCYTYIYIYSYTVTSYLVTSYSVTSY